MQELKKSFFERDTVKVAKALLGKELRVGKTSGIIVETEAYTDDEASHASRKTPRSQIMFDTYGKSYVYFVYGTYFCLNFTTEKIGSPGAVLIRALEPKSGITSMQKRRKKQKSTDLCSGPGKLCQALGLSKKHNNLELGKEIKIFDTKIRPKIVSAKRIGIKKAADLKWRFYINDNKFVSKR